MCDLFLCLCIYIVCVFLFVSVRMLCVCVFPSTLVCLTNDLNACECMPYVLCGWHMCEHALMCLLDYVCT